MFNKIKKKTKMLYYLFLIYITFILNTKFLMIILFPQEIKN